MSMDGQSLYRLIWKKKIAVHACWIRKDVVISVEEIENTYFQRTHFTKTYTKSTKKLHLNFSRFSNHTLSKLIIRFIWRFPLTNNSHELVTFVCWEEFRFATLFWFVRIKLDGNHFIGFNEAGAGEVNSHIMWMLRESILRFSSNLQPW